MSVKINSFVFFSLLADAMLSAQTVSVGVKGGFPFSAASAESSFSQDESRPYAVGPTVEFQLGASFAVEADALYRRVGNSQPTLEVFGFIQANLPAAQNFLDPATAFQPRLRGNSWEFPLLGKYYFGARAAHWQPFVSTGFAFRTVDYHSSFTVPSADPGQVIYVFQADNFRGNIGVGAVFAAGARMHLTSHFSVSPEVRYTRWGSADTSLASNQALLLVGLTF